MSIVNSILKYSNMAPSNLLTTTIFTLTLLVVIGFAATLAHATDFAVTLDISNVPPEVNYVDGTSTFTPISNSTITTYLYFNATDENGASDLNDSTAQITINRSAQSQTSNECTVISSTSTQKAYNCSIDIPYYFAAGEWTINASVSDNEATAQNTTQTFTINELKSVALAHAALSFSGVPGEADVAANEGAQVITNLGNYEFSALNTTGYDLQGVDSGALIGAGNFTVNSTANPGGVQLINATPVALSSFSLTTGEAANQSIYAYLTIPAGVEPDVYNSTNNWVLDLD